jgi:hypothetical protein
MTFNLRRHFHRVKSTIEAVSLTDRERSTLFSRLSATTLLLSLVAPFATGQAAPTAERRLNVQVGGTFSLADPGVPKNASVLYGRSSLSGGGIYTTLDPHHRFGLELGARQLFGDSVSERTYLAGPRYFKPYGHYVPYGKVLVGRGKFKFPNNIGTLSLTAVSFGGGIDYRVNPAVNVRGDYEYQQWLGFANNVHNFPGSLTPQVFSVGIAYHIR